MLYVNDKKSAVDDCDLGLYWDDTSSLFSNKNVHFVEKHLKVELTVFASGLHKQ